MNHMALYTVQHTGTTSVRQLYWDAGYHDIKAIADIRKHKEPTHPTLFRNHAWLEPPTHGWCPTVTTVRDPARLQLSWARRYGGINENPHAGVKSLPKQLACWLEHIAPIADIIIPIDIPDLARDAIREMGKLAGVEFGDLQHTNKFKGGKPQPGVDGMALVSCVRDLYQQEAFAAYAPPPDVQGR